MQKNNYGAFTLLSLIAMAMVLIACHTIGPNDVSFIKLQDGGVVSAGDTVGRFSYFDPQGYSYRYTLVSGEGDKDNNLFEIANNNSLVAERTLTSRNYSIRVKMIGIKQDLDAYGYQKIFNFNVGDQPSRTTLAEQPRPVSPPTVITAAVSSEDDFDITQNTKGTITITGYHGKAKNVVIPEKIEGIAVTEIGGGVFLNAGLTSVIIPNSITTIGNNAFSGVNYGIGGSSHLTSVIIPNSVTTIGSNAFSYNELTSVIIPNSVKSIGNGAFQYNQLTNIAIPNSIIKIESSTFANNKLTSVTIPESITTIGSNAFSQNHLTSVTIPSSVTEIDSGAFSYNYSLISITIGNGVTKYGNNVFSGAPLAIITIPANKDEIASLFPNNFRDYYISQSRKSGTYTWSGRLWSVGNEAVPVKLFPFDFVGTWKRDNYDNTLTFTENTLAASNQEYSTWFFQSVSDNVYTIKLPVSLAGPERTTKLTMKLVNGNLEIGGDSGSGQDNWNGVWKKQ